MQFLFNVLILLIVTLWNSVFRRILKPNVDSVGNNTIGGIKSAIGRGSRKERAPNSTLSWPALLPSHTSAPYPYSSFGATIYWFPSSPSSSTFLGFCHSQFFPANQQSYLFFFPLVNQINTKSYSTPKLQMFSAVSSSYFLTPGFAIWKHKCLSLWSPVRQWLRFT